jgi:hypothetical protein
MAVDWSLTETEGSSDKYKKEAYRPRIQSAYEKLINEEKLRVWFIVSQQLANKKLGDRLNTSLRDIGWKIAEGRLIPSEQGVRELFFPQGTQHDAYVKIKEILLQAKRSLRVINPYLDGTIFNILAVIQLTIEVYLLTAKVQPDFTQEAQRFMEQHTNISVEIRRSREFHDRFVIVDEETCWHLGCSIKDAGSKAFMLSQFEDPTNRKTLIDTLNSTWADAQKLCSN